MANSARSTTASPPGPKVRQSATAMVMDKLLGGVEHLVAFPGTSQYSQGGSSACGLAALNCVRLVLDLEYRGRKEGDLISLLCQQGLMTEVMSVCSYWPKDAHLELDEIYKTPFFTAHLNMLSQEFGPSEEGTFRKMLMHLDRPSRNPFSRRSSAIVITRPPEIIVCFKIVHSVKDVYIIFDSHPRPKHPKSAAFIMNASLIKTAQYLDDLLRVDEGVFDGDLQWQAQLLGNVSGHIFEHSGRDMRMSEAAERVMLDANLKLLTVSAELAGLKTSGNGLREENGRLKREVAALERQQRHEPQRPLHNANGKGKHAATSILVDIDFESDASLASSLFQVNPWTDVSAKRTNMSTSRLDSSISRTMALAKQQLPSTSKPLSSSKSVGSSKPVTSRKPIWDLLPEDEVNNDDFEDEQHSSLALAARMAREFAEEDATLRQQADDLKGLVQTTFECSVCMEVIPEDDVAKMDNCQHSFCRDCIRQYIISKIEDHRYPIVCPICATDKENRNPGMVTSFMVETVGMNEKTYRIFEELQLSEYSIILHCRDCTQSTLVDRDEFQQSKVLTCPLPTCRYQWCKNCQQQVEFGGPEHSCDGSSEMKELMQQQGWKNCPGCETPCEKISGCNSISCITPGCNTHFCYICGKMFIRSALLNDVLRAKTEHFKSCKLF